MFDRPTVIANVAALLAANAVVLSAEPFPSPFNAVAMGLGMGGFVQLRLFAREKPPWTAIIAEMGFAAFAAYGMYAVSLHQEITNNEHVLNFLCGLSGMGGGITIATLGEKILGWKIYHDNKGVVDNDTSIRNN